MTLEEIIQKYPQQCAKVTQKPPTAEFEKLPPFKLPTIEDLNRLENKFNCNFPKSFKKIQTFYGERIMVPDSFGWATPDIPPFFGVASLEDVLEAAYVSRSISNELVPFCQDEGNFYCLDITKEDQNGDCPVVFWDHDEGNVLGVSHYTWVSLASWLKDYYEDELKFA